MTKKVEYPQHIYKHYFCVENVIGGVTHYAVASRRKFLGIDFGTKLHHVDIELGIRPDNAAIYLGQIWHESREVITAAIWTERAREELQWLDEQRGKR